MWLIFCLEISLGLNLGQYGIYPRTVHGLVGILTAPLLHASLSHLVSNTIPLLFLGGAVFMFYEQIATRVFLSCYLITNALVWVIGRPNYHIGASGLIYGLAGFLMFYGIFRRDFKSLLISIIVIIIYGGLVYGVLPTNTHVSFESHLMGFLVGIGTAKSLGGKTK